MAAGLAGLAVAGSPQYMAYAEVLALLAGRFSHRRACCAPGFSRRFLVAYGTDWFSDRRGDPSRNWPDIRDARAFRGAAATPFESCLPICSSLATQTRMRWAFPSRCWPLSLVLGASIGAFPVRLIAVAGGMLAGYVGNLPAHGVALLGPVPAGLPQFELPQANLSWEALQDLLGIAFRDVYRDPGAECRHLARLCNALRRRL